MSYVKIIPSDVDVRDLLVDLHSRGHLDNTLLVTMSDHGPRMGDMRNTAQGKIEERLPMMSLAFPKQFKVTASDWAIVLSIGP